MAIRAYITQSRSGHYTVTVRTVASKAQPFTQQIAKEGKISSKQEAQRIAASWMEPQRQGRELFELGRKLGLHNKAWA